MVKLEAVELFFQTSNCLIVCLHLGVVATQLFHDVVDDESFDPELNRDVEAIDKGFVFCYIV